MIEHVRNRGAIVAATTHYAELKVYATNETGVQNASCEFDVDSLRPTYHLFGRHTRESRTHLRYQSVSG